MLRVIAFICLVISQCNAVEISNGRFETTVLVKKPIDTSLKVGEVDDWFFSGAGISNDQVKVGEDVHHVNQFAFINPKGRLSQDIELETEKTYMITWVDASLDDSSYSVSVTQLNNGVPTEFQTINTVFSIYEKQHWSNRVIFVTPLRDANYQLTFKATSGATFYIDRVAIKEVICESRDSISDGGFQKTTPSAVWEYSNNARIISLPDADPRAEIESGAYFAFCAPLFVGRYTFSFNLRKVDSVQSDLSLLVSAAEHSLRLVVTDKLDSQSASAEQFTFEVDTEGIYSFAFMSQSYGDITKYEISSLALSARIRTDLNGGIPIYTGISTDPEFNNAQFEDYDINPSNQYIVSPDDTADAIWLFNGFSGISGDASRLPASQLGFSGQFAFLEPRGKIGQAVHINSNTDVVISFLTVVQPDSIPTPADSFSFNVLITVDAISPEGSITGYPVYYSTDHKANQYVRRSFVFFTTLTSGFYDITITSATQSSIILFDDFQIETVICDKAHPYEFDFTAQGGLPGPHWELFGATVVPGIKIAVGQAAGQCIVASEASDVQYEFTVQTSTTFGAVRDTDSTPLTIGMDSIFGGKADITTYVGESILGGSSDTFNIVIELEKWNHYDTSSYPLLQAITNAGFYEIPPPTPSKYFIYAYVDAKEGTGSSPINKLYEIDAINVIERVTNTLEVNHQPYGGHIYVPQGIIGIADVFLNDTRSFDRTVPYTAKTTQPTFFITEPTFNQTSNAVSFAFSPYADGPVTITIVNNLDNTVAHLDLFLCASKKDHPVEGTTMAICVRTQSHPRDVFVRRDIVYDTTRTMVEFQPGDWWKNRILDCSCKLVDMPSKQPKYIWPTAVNS